MINQLFIFSLFFCFVLTPIYYLAPVKIQNFLIFTIGLFLLGFLNKLVLILMLLSLFCCFVCLQQFLKSDHIKKKYWIYGFIFYQIVTLIVYSYFFRNTLIGIAFTSLTLIGLSLDYLWKRTQQPITQNLILAASFGPTVLMGPIERPRIFVDQFLKKRILDKESFFRSIYLILIGLFKIFCIANAFKEFTWHQELLASQVYGFWLMAYCFLAFMKLYCEFSGFIDVIRGLSLFWGIQLSLNFDTPYLAQNPLEIWKRWHITLTSWLKEYVYIPLLLKTKKNIWPTLSICILIFFWHKATLDYFYWLLYWMTIIFIYIKFYPFLKKTRLNRFIWLNRLTMNIILTFSTLCFFIPHYTFSDIFSRLTKWSASYKDVDLLYQFKSYNWLMGGLICLGILLIFEINKKTLEPIQKYLCPVLIILILAFARLENTFFFYLYL